MLWNQFQVNAAGDFQERSAGSFCSLFSSLGCSTKKALLLEATEAVHVSNEDLVCLGWLEAGACVHAVAWDPVSLMSADI